MPKHILAGSRCFGTAVPQAAHNNLRNRPCTYNWAHGCLHQPTPLAHVRRSEFSCVADGTIRCPASPRPVGRVRRGTSPMGGSLIDAEKQNSAGAWRVTMAPRQLRLEPIEVNPTADKVAKRVRVDSNDESSSQV
eukprot:scaffold20478_cov149-Isochrysis_galbana.AAC.2